MPARNQMHLSEAQILHEIVNDPTARLCLQEFFRSQAREHTHMLVEQVRKSQRDTLKEAGLAGKVDAYETGFSELEYFSQRMLKEATQ